MPSCSSSLSFDFPMAMGCMLNCKLKEAFPHLNCTCPKSVSSQQELRPIHLLGHSGFDELPTTGLPWCGWFDCAVLIHPSRFCFSLTSSHLLCVIFLFSPNSFYRASTDSPFLRQKFSIVSFRLLISSVIIIASENLGY